jgi:hypothetical protein
MGTLQSLPREFQDGSVSCGSVSDLCPRGRQHADAGQEVVQFHRLRNVLVETSAESRLVIIVAGDTAEHPSVGFAEHEDVAKGHHSATGSAQARPSVSAAQCGMTSVPMS